MAFWVVFNVQFGAALFKEKGFKKIADCFGIEAWPFVSEFGG